jgi:arylsulfatase A-like enzyme
MKMPEKVSVDERIDSCRAESVGQTPGLTASVSEGRVCRRRFLQRSAFATGGVLAAGTSATSVAAPAVLKNRPPNILFINSDQQGLDTISGLGCDGVKTPCLDRLVAGGTSFRQSYSADPVCCPARACWFTGRPAAENGVVMNSYPLVESLPDLGQWFTERGYEAVYSGKWHVPRRDVSQSFRFLPSGSGQGELGDGAVSRACQGYLANRTGSDPFFLTAGFLQPHDICYWIMQHARDMGELPYPEILDELPELPPNFEFDAREPQAVIERHRIKKPGRAPSQWSKLHWRYYLWAYDRHVEMVDAEIGRVLDALEDSPHAKNTLVLFTSDHGEGRGRHQTLTKGFLYDEAAKVPLIARWPGHVGEGVDDTEHLVSGLDIAPTVCDYAGIPAPPNVRGQSIRPLLESGNQDWREFIVSSSGITGRMVRTGDYKYIVYKDDPVDQLFEMKNDPWETKNLADESQFASIVADHRKILAEFEAPFEVAPVRSLKRPVKGKRGVGGEGLGVSGWLLAACRSVATSRGA